MERVSSQLTRLLKLIGWVQGLKYGVTLQECVDEFSVCKRTVRRDMAVLMELGVVDRSHVYGREYRWIWRSQQVLFPAHRLYGADKCKANGRHYEDNQGNCHVCGIEMNPDRKLGLME